MDKQPAGPSSGAAEASGTAAFNLHSEDHRGVPSTGGSFSRVLYFFLPLAFAGQGIRFDVPAPGGDVSE